MSETAEIVVSLLFLAVLAVIVWFQVQFNAAIAKRVKAIEDSRIYIDVPVQRVNENRVRFKRK
jgi:hypothetical protein